MKLHQSKSIEKTVMDAMSKIRGMDPEEVFSYLEECVGGVAAHHVVSNLEYGGVKNLEHWEAQIDGFEAGMKVGVALSLSDMSSGDKVYTLCFGTEDGIPTNMCFYFVGRDAKKVAQRLQTDSARWISKFRKDRGLLPFND